MPPNGWIDINGKKEDFDPKEEMDKSYILMMEQFKKTYIKGLYRHQHDFFSGIPSLEIANQLINQGATL